MTLFEPVASRRLLSGQLLWFSLWLGVSAIGIALHADPAGHGTHQQLGLPPCPSVLLFDRPCPGCGLTTSWTALLHGNLAFSFHAHPLGPPLYLVFTLGAVLGLVGFVRNQRLILDSAPMSRALSVGAIGFLAFGLFRMATVSHFRTEQERLIARYAGTRSR